MAASMTTRIYDDHHSDLNFWVHANMSGMGNGWECCDLAFSCENDRVHIPSDVPPSGGGFKGVISHLSCENSHLM